VAAFPVVIAFGEFNRIFYVGHGQFFVGNSDRIFSIWHDLEWGIIDIHGNEIIEFGRFDPIIYYGRSGALDLLTEDGNFFVRDGNTAHIINRSGEIITSFDSFDRVYLAMYDRFIVRNGGVAEEHGDDVWNYAEWGVINQAGEFIIPFRQFDEIRRTYEGSNFIVRIGGVYSDYHGSWLDSQLAVLNRDGRTIIPLGFYNWIWDSSDRAIYVIQNRYTAVFRLCGELIIPFGRYSDVRYIGDDMFVVEHWTIVDCDIAWYGTRIIRDYALVTLDGEYLIPFGIYTSIRHLRGNLFAVTIGDCDDWQYHHQAVIDKNGTIIIPFERYESFGICDCRSIIFTRNQDENLVLLDMQLNNIILHKNYVGVMRPSCYRGMFILYERIENEDFIHTFWHAFRRVIDSDGNTIISGGIYRNIRQLFYNNWLFQVQYTPAFIAGTSSDHSNFIGPVNEFTLYDINGNTIIPRGMFGRAHGFHNGLVIVEQNGFLGVIYVNAR